MSTQHRARTLLVGAVLCAFTLIPRPAMAQRSLSLADALRSALGEDEVIATAGEEIEVAKADTATAASNLAPTIDIATSFSHANQYREVESGGNVTTQESQFDYVRADANINAPIADPSGIANLVSADQARKAVRAERDATRDDVLFGVVRAYYAALSAHSAVQAAQASAQAARTLEDAARGRMAAGTETILGVDRARADRIAAEGTAEQAGFLEQSAHLALAHAAGLPLEPLTLTTPARPTPPGGGTDARVDLALGGRPDLLSARYAVRSSRSAVAAAALSLAPSLHLRWDYRYSTAAVSLFEDQDRWFLRIQAQWILPGLFGPVAEISRSHARRRQATLAVNRIERTMELEVRSMELALDAAEAALRVARERDALSQANLDAGLRLYQAGLATGLEATTLNSERDEAAAELVWSTLARDLAEVDLLQVMGEDPLIVYGAERGR